MMRPHQKRTVSFASLQYIEGHLKSFRRLWQLSRMKSHLNAHKLPHIGICSNCNLHCNSCFGGCESYRFYFDQLHDGWISVLRCIKRGFHGPSVFLERVLPRSLLEAHFPPTEASSSPLYGQMAIKCVSLDWKPLNDSFFSAGSALAWYYSTESHRAPYRWLRTPFWLKQVIRQRGSSVAGEPFGGFPSSALKSLNCKSYAFFKGLALYRLFTIPN